MLLVDALYICYGGGLVLLKYLISELQVSGRKFFLLADARCGDEFRHVEHVEVCPASLRQRHCFYLRHKDDFTSVFCFGNIPPPLRLHVPVYTYFHNINLLTLDEAYTLKTYLMSWSKRTVYKLLKHHTDLWIVQTTNTANELLTHLGETEERVRILPFYLLPAGLGDVNGKERTDYVFIGNYYNGAKGHDVMLKAWKELHLAGFNNVLHLTISEQYPTFLRKIQEAANAGVPIVNHGFVAQREVVDLYHCSKALIYPSHNESLGLGIIEAIEAGCDVLTSDLPFAHAICRPSEVFNPYDADSIVQAVLRYEQAHSLRSQLTIQNEIWPLIDLICA